MKNIFQRDLKYYRIVLPATISTDISINSNERSMYAIYCDYDKEVKESEYINITLLDVIKSLNESISLVNAVSTTLMNIESSSDIPTMKERIALLEKKVIDQGDLIVNTVQRIFNNKTF